VSRLDCFIFTIISVTVFRRYSHITFYLRVEVFMFHIHVQFPVQRVLAKVIDVMPLFSRVPLILFVINLLW
jgi:hypothetical protein